MEKERFQINKNQDDSSTSQKKIGFEFKPINKGLGFHPMSDVNPSRSKAQPRPQKTAHPQFYENQTTQNPSHSPMGTGAQSAGQPRFATSLPPQAPPAQKIPHYQPQSPAAPSSTRSMDRPNTSLHTETQASKTSSYQAQVLARETTKSIPKSKRIQIEPAFGVGYALKRFSAYAIDTMINVTLCSIAFGIVLQQLNVTLDFQFIRSFVLSAGSFFFVFSWALILAQEIAFGTSIGKRVFRMSIQGSDSALFLRAFFFIVSLCFFGLGILWSLFDRKKRCWHDILVEVQPHEMNS